MRNDEMQAGRFLRFHRARRCVAFIVDALRAGRTVQITSYTKAWRFRGVQYVEAFKATPSGALMRRGKSWDRIDLLDVRAF